MRKMRFNPDRFHANQIPMYLVLVPLALFMALPIVFIINHAFKPIEELFAFPPKFMVENPVLDNFVKLGRQASAGGISISRYIFNSVIVTGSVVLLSMLMSSMAAFALSKLRFRAKGMLMEINNLAMMFVPIAVIIPRYLLVDTLGMINTYFAHILPLVALPVGMFLVKQFTDQVPDSLIEAAIVDGAGYFKVYYRIILPMIKSAILDEYTMLPSRTASTTGATLKHWTEGPGLFRRGDWYYLTFTGNHVCSTGYQVSFASRKGGPRGSFTQREDATLLINSVFGDDFKGLGHSANVIGPDLDSVYTTYHSLVSLTGPARLYNLDRLLTNGGLLYTTGPSNSAMPIPAMPDVWGDAGGELHGFTEQVEGYFAEIPETSTFTQEWNFTLYGQQATLLIGQRNGADVAATVNQDRISVQMITLVLDGEALWTGEVPAFKGRGICSPSPLILLPCQRGITR